MGIARYWLRAPRVGRGRDTMAASALTLIIMAAAGLLAILLLPTGCDLGGEPSVYRWTCLLPGLSFIVPALVVLPLSLAFHVNARRRRRLPDGWLVTMALAGIWAQVVLATAYLLILDPAYVGRFLEELRFVPQPFVAGATTGLIYWVALQGIGRRGARASARRVPAD